MILGATLGATVWPLITIMAICALFALASIRLVADWRRVSPATKL
jgi:MFS transporter, DHA1 family, multidrug resistance protein